VQLLSAWSLGELGDQRAVEPLIRFLDTPDDNLRVSALQSLARLGDPRAIPRMREIAAGRDEFRVRSTALYALAKLGDTEAPAALAAIVSGPRLGEEAQIPRNRVGRTKRWAAHHLVELGAVSTIPALEAAIPRLGFRDRRRVRKLIHTLRQTARSA
jgi:HEAT repeat protein